jgi:hypothetical protein
MPEQESDSEPTLLGCLGEEAILPGAAKRRPPNSDEFSPL